jgi:cobalt-zinc-cadmium efflux system membrane fusion protein
MNLYKIIPILAIVLSACSSADKENTNAGNEQTPDKFVVTLTEAQKAHSKILTAKTQRRAIANYITLNGLLEAPPQNIVSVTAPLGGFVKSTPLLQGLHLHKGDVLAELENPDFIQLQEDYLQTADLFDLAQMDLKRQEALRAGEANSEKTLQETRSKLNQLEIRKQALKQKLGMIGIDVNGLSASTITRRVVLRSPVNAYVKTVSMNVGKYFGPQDILAELVNTEHLHVELTAYEQDIPKLKEGQKMKFALANNPKEMFSAHVYLVGKSLTNERSVPVHGHLDHDESSFIPGQSVKAIIETGSDSLFSIETSAIGSMESKTVVFEKTGKDSYTMHEVKVLSNNDQYSAIEFMGEQPTRQAELVIGGVHTLMSVLLNVEEE